MRRVLTALLVLFLIVLPLCAGTAGGKVFVLSDPIYGMMDSLFLSCGHALPSSSRPWTAAEAASELSKLDGVVLDAGQTELRRRIEEMIGEEETLLLEQACDEESVKALSGSGAPAPKRSYTPQKKEPVETGKPDDKK